jgi:hypothetical protein
VALPSPCVCRLGIVVDCRVSTDWSAFRAFRSGFTAAVGGGRFFASEFRPILCELRAESPVS